MGWLKIVGFETGDLGELATIGTSAAVSTTTGVHAGGNYSLLSGTTGAALSSIAIPGPPANVFVRCYVTITNASPSGNVCALNSSVAFGGVTITIVGGKFQLNVFGGGTVIGPTVVTGRTYCLEFYNAFSSNTLRVDGFEYGTAGASALTASSFVMCSLSGVYFDDIAMRDDTYPGPGFCIARQFKAGTPTYNTWTKTGGSGTIDSVWNNTPFNAASFAVAPAAGVQTGIVADFTATQAGHGTAVLGSTDTINALKVCLYAKKGSGSTRTHTLRWIYHNNFADGPDWTAITTSDTLLDYMLPIVLSKRAIDQPSQSNSISITPTTPQAQSFTPASSFSCTGVELMLQAAGGNFTVSAEIHTGSPTGTVIASNQLVTGGLVSAFAPNSQINWTAVTLTGGVTYYLVVSINTGNISIGNSTSNPYAGGQRYASADSGATYNPVSTDDLYFAMLTTGTEWQPGLEIGGNQGVGTIASAFTIEDMWVMMDIAPWFDLTFSGSSFGMLPAAITLTRASSGTYTDAFGTLSTNASDVARFNYAGGALCLLIEPAATNLLVQSAGFAAGSQYWFPINGAVITGNTFISPEGSSNGCSFTSGTTGPGFGGIGQVVNFSNIQYAMSIWEKRIAGVGPLQVSLNGAGNVQLTTFAVITRLAATITPPAGSGNWLAFLNTASSTDVAGVFGAQLETGPVATSYIPTTSAPASRAADVATFTIPIGIVRLIYTFDDNSIQAVNASPGTYTIPTNLARLNIKWIQAVSGGGPIAQVVQVRQAIRRAASH